MGLRFFVRRHRVTGVAPGVVTALRALGLGLCLLAPQHGVAQSFDASLPDASIDMGGADQTSEENDPNASPCLSASQCDRGFSCTDGRCVPAGVRRASGCSTGEELLGVLGLLTTWRLRRARTSRPPPDRRATGG